MNMQPLLITVHLAGSIALTRPEDLALDGILAAQVLRRHFGNAFYTLPDPKECLYFARLPLKMCGMSSERMAQLATGEKWIDMREGLQDDSLWYWSCSTSLIDVKAHNTQYWNKRFDTQPRLSDHIDFGGRVAKILIEQGRYKAYHMPLPTLVTDKIMWYAYGDAEQIESLLSGISAIGKKRAQGNGAIVQIQVDAIEEDYSTWYDNLLMRPLPRQLAASTDWEQPPNIQHIAFRAPQWHPANQHRCVVGGVRRA